MIWILKAEYIYLLPYLELWQWEQTSSSPETERFRFELHAVGDGSDCGMKDTTASRMHQSFTLAVFFLIIIIF